MTKPKSAKIVSETAKAHAKHAKRQGGTVRRSVQKDSVHVDIRGHFITGPEPGNPVGFVIVKSPGEADRLFGAEPLSITKTIARIDTIAGELCKHVELLGCCASALDGGPKAIEHGLSSDVQKGMAGVLEGRVQMIQSLSGDIREFAARIQRAIG